MGGEPLCPENEFLTCLVIKTVKEKLPDTKIYLYTGYIYEDIKSHLTPRLEQILEMTDVIIDGPFIESERDISLFMRGSRNQRIIRI